MFSKSESKLQSNPILIQKIMNTFIQDIELINKYIEGTLSELEKQDVIHRLATDLEFKTLYQDQLSLIEGVKRAAIRKEIGQAKRKYKFQKITNIIGLTLLTIAIVSIVIFAFSKKQPTESKTLIEIHEVVKAEPILEEKEVVIETDSVKTTTNIFTEEINTEAIPYAEPEEEWRDVFDHSKKQPQSYKFKAEDGIEFTANEGTKVIIELNSFIQENTRKVVTGEVKIKIREFYTLPDIIKANLSTKSYDNLLETGGMLFIEAFSNDQKCILAEDKEIVIKFPFKREKEGMKLFTATKVIDTMNWNLNKQEPIITKIANEIDNEPFISAIEYTLSKDSIGSGIIIRPKDSRALVPFSKESYYTYFEGKTFSINFGKIPAKAKNGFSYTPRASIGAPNDQLKPGIYWDNVGETYYTVVEGNKVVSLNIGITPKIAKGDTTYIKRENPKPDLKKVTENDISNYVLRSANLGWINCDRFINSKKAKIKFKVKRGKNDNIKSKLIFKNYRSVLSGKKDGNLTSFNGVPIGEKVLILAIKKEEGKFYLAINETVTSNKTSDFQFEEVTLNLLNKKINDLKFEN